MNANSELFSRIWPYVRPYRRWCAGSLGLAVAAAAVAVMAPWPVAWLVDGMMRPGGDAAGSVTKASATALLIMAVGALVFAARQYIHTTLATRSVVDLQSNLFAHAVRQASVGSDMSSAIAIERVNRDATSLGQVIVGVPALIEAALTVGLMTVVALTLDLGVAVVALLGAPLVFAGVRTFARRVVPQLEEARRAEAVPTDLAVESLSMLRLIACFGREDYEHGRFYRRREDAGEFRMAVTRNQSVFELFVALGAAARMTLILWIGGSHVIDGSLSMGGFLVLISYVHGVRRPLTSLRSTSTAMRRHVAAVRRVFEYADSAPEIKDRLDARFLVKVQGALAAEGLSYTYADGTRALDGVTMSVEPGSVTAIVGPHGAGKSTLVAMLMRFVDPEQGCVTIDGLDTRTYTLASLRNHLGYVGPDPFVFRGTVMENIRYGRMKSNDLQVVEAAVLVQAHPLIMNLPNGYDTVVGDGGYPLTTLERQMICIARTALQGAAVLVLDEPAQQLSDDEALTVYDALDILMRERTTVIATEDLLLVEGADHLVLLDRGSVLCAGTFEDVTRATGVRVAGPAPAPAATTTVDGTEASSAVAKPAATATAPAPRPIEDAVRTGDSGADGAGSTAGSANGVTTHATGAATATAPAGAARAETARAETARAETVRAETARAETVRAETARIEAARAETAEEEAALEEAALEEAALEEIAGAETAGPEWIEAAPIGAAPAPAPVPNGSANPYGLALPSGDERLMVSLPEMPAWPSSLSALADPSRPRGAINVILTSPPGPGGVCTAEVAWEVTGVSLAEVRVGSPDGPLFAVIEDIRPEESRTEVIPAGPWVKVGTWFFLQDRTGGRPLLNEYTLASAVAERAGYSTDGRPLAHTGA